MLVRRVKAAGHGRLLVFIAVLALLLAGCGGADDGEGAAEEEDPEAAEETEQEGAEAEETEQEEAEGEVVELQVSPTGLPFFVAAEEGLYDGVNVDVSQVGYDAQASLFLAGDTPLSSIAPVEVAEFVSQGEDFVYFSTAGAANMINGLVVRTEDADKYQSIDDLVGEKLGNPGFGTGTWATFQVIAGSQYGLNAEEDFEAVTADSGALLGLLEQGQIEAALLFTGQSAAALANEQFTTIFSFTEAMQEQTGQPMVINGPVARTSWLEDHPEEAAAIIEGADEAVQWISDHPEEFQEGGKYEEWIRAEGWLESPETTAGIMELVEAGEWYFTSEIYTEEWIDTQYELIESGEGVLVEEVPAKDDVFYPPEELE